MESLPPKDYFFKIVFLMGLGPIGFISKALKGIQTLCNLNYHDQCSGTCYGLSEITSCIIVNEVI